MQPSLFGSAPSHPEAFRDIEPSLLFAHLNQARIIDVREHPEYAGELGHIEGAELVPLATVANAARGWSRNDEIVVVCRSGARSTQASRELVSMGFTRVMNLRGGMIAWSQAALPVAR
jgi:sulfur-carrier protein adenylyltransferase/sulfurtransferase